MIFQLNNLQKNPRQHLGGKVQNLNEVKLLLAHPLVKEVKNLAYDLSLNFDQKTLVLAVDGAINFSLLVQDALDGEKFEWTQKINWNEDYNFQTEFNSHSNFVLNKTFDLLTYLVEQINLNIPINLSNKHDIISKTGSGWELLSETAYQFQENANNVPDPRWEKLEQLKK